MLGETEKSSDVCRTASLSEMGHEQRVATSSTVTDQRQKTSLSVSRRSRSRYRQIAACCGTEMTSASGGRNRVAHHRKVDWGHLVKTLEYQQTDLVLQTLLNGQPVQSISDVLLAMPFSALTMLVGLRERYLARKRFLLHSCVARWPSG